MKKFAYLLCILVAINNSPLLANSLKQDPATVLITGSNRGIGLALAEHYAKEGWKVIATCRKPNQAVKLKTIADKHPLVMIEEIDVTNIETINKVANKYQDSTIDVLINNAGISGGFTNQVFGNFDYSIFERVIDVNTFGPARMAEAFLDHVAASRQKKIINITSTQGSIARTRGGQYFYKASKAALNMITKNLSQDLKSRKIIVGLISPGWVITDIVEGFKDPRMLKPEESAYLVDKVIDSYTPDQSGYFFDETGTVVPW
ncbi:MAG: SDR family oxidoreductase [Gammaproteobacteria bacterium]|jgi:NAD(P)-dependent dehydrogenase (short-subunit alcohol dehydrogenase family)|nr:short-chain dehydrogenase [Chromatiales bacterium]MDP7296512.1 SDR family oxidoreductase [Gammaproteobacteria bacterium]MDP7419940.1 SDR family oxidoreductase [Gammaproteobacteria bacterium]MDP7660782.1 SDR family oxidoreductase [Gammaproteobacteria bacterium]HJP37742.1 SDR family oxidoreductase [Gammaproteobacteria bacterium]